MFFYNQVKRQLQSRATLKTKRLIISETTFTILMKISRAHKNPVDKEKLNRFSKKTIREARIFRCVPI